MLIAILFMIITFSGYFLALKKGPIWGLIVYTYLYFMPPYTYINWWARYVPDLRWGWVTPGIWLISIFLHRDKLSTHKFGISYWVFMFFILTQLLTITVAVDVKEATQYSYNLFLYCVTIVFMIKTLAKFEHLRLFALTLVVMCLNFVLTTYSEGKFLDGRLNNVGPGDANGSNELALFLASIIPFSIPFIVRGRRHEKITCLLMLPAIINIFTLTVSRGAFVSLLLSSFYGFVFIASKKIKKNILVMAACVLPLFVLLADDGYIERISSIWNVDRSSDEALNSLSSGRTETWKDGFRMVNDYPLGAGPGGFRVLSRFYMQEGNLSFKPGYEYGVRAAHNTYLLVLTEQGYLGFFIFLMICFSTIYILFKSSQTIRRMGLAGTFVDLFIVGLNISFVCTICGGLFGSRVYYEFFWWQIALSVVASSFVKEMVKVKEDPSSQVNPIMV